MAIDITLHQLYIAYFGRPADKSGFQYWETIAAKSGISAVAKAFAGSAEFAVVLGRSSVHFADAVYQNLFGHAPSEEARAALLARLGHGDDALEKFVLELMGNAAAADTAVLELKTAAAASFTAALDLLGDSVNLMIPHTRMLTTGGAYLAAVKDGASLDLALTGLVDTVMSLASDAAQPAPVPPQPVTFDPDSMMGDIQALYIGYFGRPADPAGYGFWEHSLAGAGLAPIRAAFTLSQEFAAQTEGLSPASVVNAVYLNSFGRSADLPGLTYWTDLLSAKAITIEQVVESVQAGAQGADALTLRNKVILASSLTMAIDAVDVVSAWGTVQANYAKAFLAAVGDEVSLETLMASVYETAKIIGGAEPPPMPLPTF